LPVSDESQFRIVLRGPVGQRVEKTEQQVAEVERVLRAQIPAEELETIVSSTGVLAQGRSSLFNPNTGPHTSSISVHLVTPDKRTRNQVQIMNDVRPKVLQLFPGVSMSFDPGGLIKRITSFGSQKSVDVEIYGYDLAHAREAIRQVESMMHQIPGLADIEAHNLALPGDVLVVQGVAGISSMGGVSASIGKRQGEIAAVVDGAVRDIDHSRSIGYPIWSAGVSPITGKWRIETIAVNDPVKIAGIEVKPGDLVIADECGVCFVPFARAAEVLAIAQKLAASEKARLEKLESGIPLSEYIKLPR